MERIRKFLAFPAADYFLLVEAAILLGLVAVMLRLLPFPWMRRLLLGQDPGSAGVAPERVVRRIVWSVRTASRYTPAATCLPQAIVTRLLLKRRGYAATLRIGVAMNGAGQLVAHAWVEREGRIIIGGTDSYRRYAALPPLEKEGA